MNFFSDSQVIRTGWNFRALQPQASQCAVKGNEFQKDPMTHPKTQARWRRDCHQAPILHKWFILWSTSVDTKFPGNHTVKARRGCTCRCLLMVIRTHMLTHVCTSFHTGVAIIKCFYLFVHWNVFDNVCELMMGLKILCFR